MAKKLLLSTGVGVLFVVFVPISTAYLLQTNVFTSMGTPHGSQMEPGDMGQGNFDGMHQSGPSVGQLKQELKRAEKEQVKAKKDFDKMKKKVDKYNQAITALDACTESSEEVKKEITACKRAFKKVVSAMRRFPMMDMMDIQSLQKEMQGFLADLGDAESSDDIDQVLEDFHGLVDGQFSSESFEEDFNDRMEEISTRIQELQEEIEEAEANALEQEEEDSSYSEDSFSHTDDDQAKREMMKKNEMMKMNNENGMQWDMHDKGGEKKPESDHSKDSEKSTKEGE